MLGVSSGLVAGFGGDLPALTQLALEKTHYALIPALVGAGAFTRLWLNREKGSRMAITTLAVTGIAFGFSVSMIIAWFIAMYLPIFRMGSVVS